MKLRVIPLVVGIVFGWLIWTISTGVYHRASKEPDSQIYKVNLGGFHSAKGNVSVSKDGEWFKLSFNDKQKTADVWAAVQANVQLDPKKRYRISYHLKYDDGKGVQFFMSHDPLWNSRLSLLSSGYATDCQCGEESDGMTGPITFVLESPGTVWIKSFTIQEVK
jgi:hypothetical protein